MLPLKALDYHAVTYLLYSKYRRETICAFTLQMEEQQFRLNFLDEKFLKHPRLG